MNSKKSNYIAPIIKTVNLLQKDVLTTSIGENGIVLPDDEWIGD